ncbi:MAG: ABC transporter ATP-binding protein [Ignavibacteriaceae bacterium]|nr:ABC transporter ATP-binding protein [Ignavibacteriaceae bacterium]NUM70225.1 ABC transporter ATP-binding protein [Ignavibacteriaceae bacterium]
MSIIKVTDLTKIYNKTRVPVYALNGVSLEFSEGEFTAIVGPSGCGKTTFLNMVGGLDKPSSGAVEISGTNLASLKPGQLTDFRLHNIGFIFQAYNLIPVLTTKENVEFILELQGVPAGEREKKILPLLESVGLSDKLNNRPNELSGGQQQRVAVARALASSPKFILADEPTANLDSKSADSLLDIMLKMNEELKVTFIFSTHDSRVMKKARRIITFEDGKVAGEEIR